MFDSNSMKDWEMRLNNAESSNLTKILMNNSLLKKNSVCRGCSKSRPLDKHTFVKEKCAWRCYSSKCPMLEKYISVRKGFFVEKFTIGLRAILKIMVKWAAKNQFIISIAP